MSALPPELRTMVMTGATAMMNGGGPNPNMMAGMNPMMDMSGMGGMNMGPMGMGMNGDMQMQMQQGGPMMPEGQGQGPSEQAQMAMPDGYAQGPNGQGMMGMNMGGEYAMQQVNVGIRALPYLSLTKQLAGPKSNGAADVPRRYGRQRYTRIWRWTRCDTSPFQRRARCYAPRTGCGQRQRTRCICRWSR